MRHIFLTGAIQIGKSTVVRKTLALLDMPYGGFRTYFGRDRAGPDHCLYMSEASGPPVWDEAHVVARFYNLAPPAALAARFDTAGVRYIRAARQSACLIVMDECGNLEREALFFQDEILDALEGDIPVLGVVKLDSTGWTDPLRHHNNVELLTVSAENRDALPAYCRHRLAVSIARGTR